MGFSFSIGFNPIDDLLMKWTIVAKKTIKYGYFSGKEDLCCRWNMLPVTKIKLIIILR